MAQIYGTTLNKKRQLLSALKSLVGLNIFQITKVCNELGLGLDCKVVDLSQYHILKLLKLLEKSNVLVESSLKTSTQVNIKRLIDIKSYRGLKVVRKKYSVKKSV